MEAQSLGIRLVRSREELFEAVTTVLEEFDQEVLLEEFVSGPEYQVSLVGNGKELRAFPVTGIHLGDEDIYTREAKLKHHLKQFCPAVEGEMAEELFRLSKRAFKALNLRDYARFDVTLDKEGRIYFSFFLRRQSCRP